jgi:hypothetical protein
MANYGIRIKDVEIPDISIKDVALVEVFVKDVQVWEEASTGGEIITLQIVDDGDGSGGGPNVPPLYTVPQLSSDGSGTGAEFNITVTFNSQKWIMTVTAASIDSDNPGSGYAVGEIVTLDMSSVYGSWSEPEIEVLTVTT